ncbi:hypothetical protein OUZ56_005533 [Daphnia magna]|uniref:Uncharacterized protein n=1 Tax=Daphnia magna TaxID=35525 RepID=A0ABQ9YT47_9CRUS|nr:hypothetical protein OUZ56_005533 [Daphnia magna]
MSSSTKQTPCKSITGEKEWREIAATACYMCATRMVLSPRNGLFYFHVILRRSNQTSAAPLSLKREKTLTIALLLNSTNSQLHLCFWGNTRKDFHHIMHGVISRQ